ncbi:hypothetical protein AVEN_18700-1 [Araneus ventricosus]|uniref:Uncharacterized protein n=1 Tax=Araneus ventricosus TaxID=182803 RepID=A0A4Y2PKW6_ARAVE|nr:hypothetical protein AVEN_18700-1 [Araneus ventricosus]
MDVDSVNNRFSFIGGMTLAFRVRQIFPNETNFLSRRKSGHFESPDTNADVSLKPGLSWLFVSYWWFSENFAYFLRRLLDNKRTLNAKQDKCWRTSQRQTEATQVSSTTSYQALIATKTSQRRSKSATRYN